MGVIAKKRNGACWVFVNHRGQRKAKRVGSKDAANELKAKIEARLSAGDLGILEKPSLTFAQATERWLEGYVKPCLKRRSYEIYSVVTRRYLAPAFGSIYLKEITRERVKGFVADLHAKGVSRRYAGTILATLSGILHQAIEDGHLDHNPASAWGVTHDGRMERQRSENG